MPNAEYACPDTRRCPRCGRVGLVPHGPIDDGDGFGPQTFYSCGGCDGWWSVLELKRPRAVFTGEHNGRAES
jgi:hypothetical protein